MTACNGCGDCCERISLSANWNHIVETVEWAREWRAWAWENLRDGEDGGMMQADLDHVHNAEFILANWTPIPEDAALPMPRFQCAAFDTVTRTCTAYARRPPICSGYPWYGGEPLTYSPWLSPRCSFWADVPLDRRPGASLRCLPVLQPVRTLGA